ncbi:hypothetical protein CFC21_004636 [Triticum aestivum]|uniref:Late embryogenesis abundant protein LEA-2 subgroup domain-containing protein n=2 Tax=Triticum aestivum TaxID=4565 RepID=A0A9R1D7Z9_WHEAT|nr:hypothetical protein CFC21_004636 [Triticum aestivum]
MGRRRRDYFSHETQRRCAKLSRRLAIGFTVAAVLAAVVLIVLRFAVVPEVKADVEDARLNQFALATTKNGKSIFCFNISIALKVRNPNMAMSVKYTEPLAAAFIFFNRRLCNASVAYEGHRHPPRRTEVHLLHPGGEVPSDLLGAAAVEEFKKQNATGVFDVGVRLSGEITLGIGNTRKLSLRCPISLQLAPTATLEFGRVNCEPDEPQTNYF